MKAFVLAFLILPALALGSVTPSTVSTSRISTLSPARYVSLESFLFTTVNGGFPRYWMYSGPGCAKLVDVIVQQTSAGTVGTSWTVDVKLNGGTAMLSTPATVTTASGNLTVTDARGALTLPSGWTRPVIAAGATACKGDMLYLSCSEVGAFNPHAGGQVNLVFEPLQ